MQPEGHVLHSGIAIHPGCSQGQHPPQAAPAGSSLPAGPQATYINITTEQASCEDIRLAYCKLMTELDITDVEASASQRATPPSAFEVRASLVLRPCCTCKRAHHAKQACSASAGSTPCSQRA